MNIPVEDQGADLNRYRIIPRTLIFVFDADGRVLLLRGSADKRLWANRYNGIGGHIEPGEDVLSSARRELREETGIAAVALRLCGTLLVDTQSDIGIGIFVFRGEYSGQALTASGEGQLEWLDPDCLSEVKLVEDVPHLLAQIAAMKPGDAPFSARSFYDESGQLHIEFC